MSQSTPPVVSPCCDGENDYTEVTFVPDMKRLANDDSVVTIPLEDYGQMCQRVFDLAGCTFSQLQMCLNDVPLPPLTFREYAAAYLPTDQPVLYHKLNSRWEVAIAASPSQQPPVTQSFANGIRTRQNGTHVARVQSLVYAAVQNHVCQKNKDLPPSLVRAAIRRHVSLFLNCLIENPSFDSQTKDRLTSAPHTFGSEPRLPRSFIKELCRSSSSDSSGDEWGGIGLVDLVVESAVLRQRLELARSVKVNGVNKKKSLDIAKLDDAHGVNKSGLVCTLILTEGDSAKALAVSGLEVLGRETFGIFPLRGKLLNVRDVSFDKLRQNEEVNHLCQIIGLEFDKTYETREEREGLRYGRVMLMTDQDADGSHIKGLVINFFRYFWPALLHPPKLQPHDGHVNQDDDDGSYNFPFLSQFRTPLLKASNMKQRKDVRSFYSLKEYEKWKEEVGDALASQYRIKYYKGLGTSTPAEAKEYFSSFDHHHISFYSTQECGPNIDMIFDKSRASDRKQWILHHQNQTSSETSTTPTTKQLSSPEKAKQELSYHHFLNNELIHFSQSDNNRSLPHALDGLKPSQRKVLFAALQRNKEQKVAQLTGFVSERTAYHHGEASLHATIIAMAQDFVGSGNINLLQPRGQFGTRSAGGKDAASARYIYTVVADVTKRLFPAIDNNLLPHKEEDGVTVEPEYYLPVLPLLVINGCQGIGTGWSTFIPPHHPKDVMDYLRAKLNRARELPPVRPYVRGFTGDIVPRSDHHGGYITRGVIAPTSRTTVRISELPVGKWTNDYKTHLLKMMQRGEISSFVEKHTTTRVHFEVTMRAAALKWYESLGLHNVFKLTSTLGTKNMNAFVCASGSNDDSSSGGGIAHFQNVLEIIDEYYPHRLELYRRRRRNEITRLTFQKHVSLQKKTFVVSVLEGTIDLGRRRGVTKEDTVRALRDSGVKSWHELEEMRRRDLKSVAAAGREEEEDDGRDVDTVMATTKTVSEGYDYLLNMPLSSLTEERIEKLEKELTALEHQLEVLERATPEDLWREDLDLLEPYL